MSSSSRKPSSSSQRKGSSHSSKKSSSQSGVPSNKSINLRILLADVQVPEAKDLITGTSKLETEVSFKCNITTHDNMIEEHLSKNQINYIRFRHLSIPPPTLPLNTYTDVSTIHVSCVFPIRWLFSHFSAFPRLKIVNFGASCFIDSDLPNHQTVNLKLERSASVSELIIRVELSKLEESESHLVKHRIGTILDCAVQCFSNLKAVDFVLPLYSETHLISFRNLMPQFKSIGNESRCYERNALVFKASVPSPSSRPNGSKSSKSSSNQVPEKKSKSDKRTVELVDLESSDTDEMEMPATQPIQMPDTPKSSPEQTPATETEPSPPPTVQIRQPKTVITVTSAPASVPAPNPVPAPTSLSAPVLSVTPAPSRVSDPRLRPRPNEAPIRTSGRPARISPYTPVNSRGDRGGSPSLLDGN